MVKLKPHEMADQGGLLDGTHNIALAAHGSIGYGSGYGFARRGISKFGDTRRFTGIYQKRNTGYNQHGYIPGKPKRTYYVRMRPYRPTNPRTEAQQANRTKFADANVAWPLLTEDERAKYNAIGKKRGRTGRSLFISWYMKNTA